MSETQDYLDAVDDHLPLVEITRLEVIDELFDHIEASALELEAEGMAPYDAEREAIRRMGDPEQLATDLGKARESRRRLVPAAGYVAIGVARAWLGGYATGIMVLVAVAAAFMATLTLAGQDVPEAATFRALAGLAGAVLPPFLAYVIGRAIPYRLALRADRSLEWAQRVTMLVGGAALLAMALLTERTAPDLWSIVPSLVAPVLLLLGVRDSEDRPEALVHWRDLAALALVTVIVAGAALMLRPGWTYPAVETFGGFETGTPVPGTVGTSAIDGPLAWADLITPSGRDATFAVFAEAPGLPGLTELRLEVWKATVDGTGLDPTATAPLFTRAVAVDAADDGSIRSEVRLDSHLMREWPPTWRVLTAATPDGARHVLDQGPNGEELAYRGTALEWLLGL